MHWHKSNSIEALYEDIQVLTGWVPLLRFSQPAGIVDCCMMCMLLQACCLMTDAFAVPGDGVDVPLLGVCLQLMQLACMQDMTGLWLPPTTFFVWHCYVMLCYDMTSAFHLLLIICCGAGSATLENFASIGNDGTYADAAIAAAAFAEAASRKDKLVDGMDEVAAVDVAEAIQTPRA